MTTKDERERQKQQQFEDSMYKLEDLQKLWDPERKKVYSDGGCSWTRRLPAAP